MKASVAREVVTVTVPPAFADKWLLRRVERLQRAHPEIDLVVDTNGRLVDFDRERVDVGIRYGPGGWPGLVAARMMTDAFFSICSPALLQGEHPLRNAEDLRHRLAAAGSVGDGSVKPRCDKMPECCKKINAGLARKRLQPAAVPHQGAIMSVVLRCVAWTAASTAFACASWAQAPAGSDRPPAILPLASEPAPKIVAYPPIAEALARGVVILQYRTENLRVMPVFGAGAVAVSPQLGHVHVTVDDWQGTWAHTSLDPIIVVGLKPGPHKILLELADPAHKILASTTVAFTVPAKKADAGHKH